MRFAMTILLCSAVSLVRAQETPPFKDEVDALREKYDTVYDPSQETIVFTGSSSIRMWHNVQESYPEHTIVNTGFGGSQASDLSYFIYDLILRFHPKKVFIYEGDNDIFAGKSPNTVRNTMQQIIGGIQRNDSTTRTVIIAAKPSIARWKLRGKYKRLNRKLQRLAEEDPLVEFADVWHPMLEDRELFENIFIEDGLHMNAEGYQIWYSALEPFVN